jgi:predicted nucleotide-binding protein
MAKRKTPAAPPPERRQMTVEEMRKANGIIQRRIDDLNDFNPAAASEDAVVALERSIAESLERAFGKDSSDYFRFLPAAQLDNAPITMSPLGDRYPRDTKRYWTEGKASALSTLNGAMSMLRERIADAGPDAAHPPSAEAAIDPDHIFIVHGRDGEVKNAVARFITTLGLTPIILDEQANQGRTVIEKFEDHSDVRYAVVLLTPDDIGGLVGGAQKPRARQNVVLELGFFAGKLGRKRVCAIVRGSDLEVPSDIAGLVSTAYEDEWKLKLARELKAAGYDIDMNNAL